MATSKKPTKRAPASAPAPAALVYSAEVSAPAGIDGTVYETVLLVSRRDGKALSAAELATVEAALEGEAPKPKAAPKKTARKAAA